MSWTHLGDTYPKARKEHRCYLCGLRIRKGARHVRRDGIADGEFVACRMHAVCESHTKAWDETDWECFDESDFRFNDLRLPLLELTQ